ncbi:hypothetical protein PanWU01x14_220790 [Parasponia andersonii]|uniref:Uncharacterized protein n=1 Tax=Parasponia andersonii TaxID=3476 RepID=A0A2P5BPX1_PARAD|nr:hypothetical protein PanWU01x14_220790 [Parasponia andersonii]
MRSTGSDQLQKHLRHLMSPGLHVCCSLTDPFLKCSIRAQHMLPDLDPTTKNMVSNPSLLVQVWPRPNH